MSLAQRFDDAVLQGTTAGQYGGSMLPAGAYAIHTAKVGQDPTQLVVAGAGVGLATIATGHAAAPGAGEDQGVGVREQRKQVHGAAAPVMPQYLGSRQLIDASEPVGDPATSSVQQQQQQQQQQHDGHSSSSAGVGAEFKVSGLAAAAAAAASSGAFYDEGPGMSYGSSSSGAAAAASATVGEGSSSYAPEEEEANDGSNSTVVAIRHHMSKLKPVDWSSWPDPSLLIPGDPSSTIVISWDRAVTLFRCLFDAAYAPQPSRNNKGSKKAHFDCVERGDNNFNSFDGIKGLSWSTLMILDALMYNVVHGDKNRHSSWQRRTFNQHDVLHYVLCLVCSESLKRDHGSVFPSNVQVRIQCTEWASYGQMAALLPTLKSNSKSSLRYAVICKLLTDELTVGTNLPHVIISSVARAMDGFANLPRKNYTFITKPLPGSELVPKPIAYIQRPAGMSTAAAAVPAGAARTASLHYIHQSLGMSAYGATAAAAAAASSVGMSISSDGYASKRTRPSSTRVFARDALPPSKRVASEKIQEEQQQQQQQQPGHQVIDALLALSSGPREKAADPSSDHDDD